MEEEVIVLEKPFDPEFAAAAFVAIMTPDGWNRKFRRFYDYGDDELAAELATRIVRALTHPLYHFMNELGEYERKLRLVARTTGRDRPLGVGLKFQVDDMVSEHDDLVDFRRVPEGCAAYAFQPNRYWDADECDDVGSSPLAKLTTFEKGYRPKPMPYCLTPPACELETKAKGYRYAGCQRYALDRYGRVTGLTAGWFPPGHGLIDRSNDPARIKLFRQVLTDGFMEVEGQLVDAMTASLVVSIWDQLSEKNREKWIERDIIQFVDIAWKLKAKE